jgi:hypothetical protein
MIKEEAQSPFLLQFDSLEGMASANRGTHPKQ